MIAIRMDEKEEGLLAKIAKMTGKTKSGLVRESVSEYLKKFTASPWELGKNLFGKQGSPHHNLASQAKQRVREKIHGKRRQKS